MKSPGEGTNRPDKGIAELFNLRAAFDDLPAKFSREGAVTGVVKRAVGPPSKVKCNRRYDINGKAVRGRRVERGADGRVPITLNDGHTFRVGRPKATDELKLEVAEVEKSRRNAPRRHPRPATRRGERRRQVCARSAAREKP